MSKISAFFQDADTQAGAFYPNHYLLVAFPTLARADLARKGLSAGGAGYEVIAASGDEVARFFIEHREKGGLWGAFMTELSRTFDTGANEADQDLEAAAKGAGFLAVYCPSEEVKTNAWKLLDPFRPVAARYYTAAGIEHLCDHPWSHDLRESLEWPECEECQESNKQIPVTVAETGLAVELPQSIQRKS